MAALTLNAHSSTPRSPTPVFLPSREETQTMAQEKLGPELRPPQTLHLLGKRETQIMVQVWRVIGVGVDKGALIHRSSGPSVAKISNFLRWQAAFWKGQGVLEGGIGR